MIGDCRWHAFSFDIDGTLLTGAASAEALRDAGALHVIPSVLELPDLG